jgi:hypothetical protein
MKAKPQTVVDLLAANLVSVRAGNKVDVYEVCRIEGVAVGLSWRKLSDRTAYYHVAAWTDGTLECDCWGFLRHRHCKHAENTAKVLELMGNN